MHERGLGSSPHWFVCLARWAVVGLTWVLLAPTPWNPEGSDPILLLCLGWSVMNLTCMAFLWGTAWLPQISLAAVIADLGFSLVAVALTGSVDSPAFVLPLFPILVASIGYGWQAGLLAAGLTTAEYVTIFLQLPEDAQWSGLNLQLVAMLMLYLLAALVGAGLAARGVPEPGSLWLSQGKAPPRLRAGRSRSIFELLATLSASLNYRRVLDTILDIDKLGLGELGDLDPKSVRLALVNSAEGMYPIVSRRLSQVDEKVTIPGLRGYVGRTITTAEPVIGRSLGTDPELSCFESLRACRSLLCLPLRVEYESHGVVIFASQRPNLYTQHQADLLSVLCDQATVALQNATLYQTLRDERDKLIDQEEEARARLARELHDGPTQDIAAVAMRMNYVRLLMDRDPARARRELENIEESAHQAVKQIRAMLFTLRPLALESEGLIAALAQFAQHLRESAGVPIQVEADESCEVLDLESQGVVFAIIQEAVGNARKHARAKNIWVRVTVKEDLFVAQVEDDGLGFDPSVVRNGYGRRSSQSMGLLNMEERAAWIDGQLKVDSEPGRGTCVTLAVPIVEGRTDS